MVRARSDGVVADAVPVERRDVDVMFLRTEDDPADIRRGWERLESLVTLHGRKFYGAFYPETKEYRVCAEVHDGDDPDALGVETGTLPGGRYLRVRLKGEPPEVYERIGPTFVELANSVETDEARPSIEFYRRRDEIDLLLPVAEPSKLR
jgi:GyrI-like small molecule binding domain